MERSSESNATARADWDVQRIEERRPVVAFVWYEIIHAEPASDTLNGLARSCDVSGEGAGILTTHPLPNGARVFLEIATGDGNISLVGRIMHCAELDDGYFRTGIHIEIVPPNDRSLLARLIAR